MRYLQIVGTVLCVLLAWIAWELREIGRATGTVSGSVEISGKVGVDSVLSIRTNAMDPIGVEIHQ
jgi:hypothetical protein